MTKLLGGLAVLLVLAPPAARAQEVNGTLTVQNASTPLNHVYAFWKDQQPFSPALNLYVLLADVPVADDVLPRNDRANAKMAELVRTNRIHAFELHFTDTGKTLDPGENGAIYHNGVAPARHGLVGFFVFDPAHVDADTVEGRLRMDPEMASLAPFNVAATFKITVPPKR